MRSALRAATALSDSRWRRTARRVLGLPQARSEPRERLPPVAPLEAAAAALLASPWQVAIARQRALSAFPAAFGTGSPSPQAPRPQCPRQSAITALAWCSEEDIDSLMSFAC